MEYEVSKCDICTAPLVGSSKIGNFPVADDLSPTQDAAIAKDLVPVVLALCKTCLTINQMIRLDNRVLFPANYHYRANLTEDVKQGMTDLLVETNKLQAISGKTLLDVGTNDGTLLDLALSYSPRITIGVEPTDAINDNLSNRHIKYKDYFTLPLAKKIKDEAGPVDFIIFTNVFAHIDPFSQLIDAVLELMHHDTLLVIENHYLGSVLKHSQFDTFYHEHPRTYSLTSFLTLSLKYHLSIVDVMFPDRYGGNIRVFLKKTEDTIPTSQKVRKIVSEEARHFPRQYNDLLSDIDLWRERVSKALSSLKSDSVPFFFRTFPARSAVLLGLLPPEIVRDVPICEQAGSKKIGYHIPRTGNKIIDIDECTLLNDPKSVCVNLSWHISDEIKEDMANRGFTGQFLDIMDLLMA